MKKRIVACLLAMALMLNLVTGCSNSSGGGTKNKQGNVKTTTEETTESLVSKDENGFPMASLSSVIGKENTIESNIIEDNNRMYYELFVYSFCDSDGDGIGDLQGVIKRLDYIKDLGCNGIWLMPIMPSTTYHKYDVTNYMDIDEQYGTMEDFEQLVEECEKRDIKLIIDLVLNHTSSQHEWFVTASDYLRSLKEGEEPDVKECPYVDYYNFVTRADAGDGYGRIDATEWYYECPFWYQMPDLNLSNENVKKEIKKIVDFWLAKGVGGFRLDACKEYYSGEIKKNIKFLSWLSSYCKSIDEDCYLVGEVWEDFDTYKQYYESGVDSFFDFRFAGNDGTIVTDVIQSGNGQAGSSMAKRICECQDAILKINKNAINAPFLTNHDVGRLAGFLRHDESWMKFAGAVNILMSGSAFLYYGEELGMDGTVSGNTDKDENKRAPMYWTAGEDKDKVFGMSNGPEAMDNVEHQFDSYEEQVTDPLSIYNYYRQVIQIRNAFPSVARGIQTTMDKIEDGDICAIAKEYEDEKIYIIMNDSKEEKEITISKEDYYYTELAASLAVDENAVTLEEETLTLPPYSIAVLR